MIPYGRQQINQSDIDAVVEVLRSDYLTQGPVIPAFEKAVSAYCGSQHAVAVTNATSALHIACLALEVGPGDLVWTSPISFVASANCALYCGASVDFVDIDADSYNLSIPALSLKLAQAEKTGKLPKVLIPVHLCGQSCDMKAIHDLALRYDFKVIEDASHAIGARYGGEPIGNCRYSDITVFSFHPVKVITTGEGGMAVTNSPDLANRLNLFRSHGITRDAAQMTEAPHGPWYYQQIQLGFNYRMTDIQAALGLSQLNRLDQFVEKRTGIARRYDELLSNLPVKIPVKDANASSSLHLYVVRLQLEQINHSHKTVFESLRNNGIGVNLHYIPIYHQPYYRLMGFEVGHCPEAENYYAEAISLPIFPALTDSDQDNVVSSLQQALA